LDTFDEDGWKIETMGCMADPEAVVKPVQAGLEKGKPGEFLAVEIALV
jgi:hypothetical protein